MFPHLILLYSHRRAYTDVLRNFFEMKLLSSQNLFSTEERYEKILDMIHDECMQSIVHFYMESYFPCNKLSDCDLQVIFAAVTSELRGKWQENRRSTTSKEDINVIRWEQLKSLLQSGKQKV